MTLGLEGHPKGSLEARITEVVKAADVMLCRRLVGVVAVSCSRQGTTLSLEPVKAPAGAVHALQGSLGRLACFETQHVSPLGRGASLQISNIFAASILLWN